VLLGAGQTRECFKDENVRTMCVDYCCDMWHHVPEAATVRREGLVFKVHITCNLWRLSSLGKFPDR
jgi:hypothetical protein